MTTTTEDASVVLTDAELNCKGHLETIQLWHEVHDWCQGNEGPNALSWPGRRFLIEEMDWAHDPDRDAVAEAIREQVLEDPLEVAVREDWHEVGEQGEAAEFMILLSTGGPALRLKGRLADGEPTHAWLEHQNWFTPWTYYQTAADDALIWYASQFYWEV